MLALIKSIVSPRHLLTAEWRNLVMLNFDADPACLARYVPGGTELDTFHGRTLVSLVGFEFLSARFNGLAVPGHRNFPEVNLRCYVRRKTSAGWRRGVVFIQEIAPRWIVAQIARRVYHENYVCAPMRHSVKLPDAVTGAVGQVCYEWRYGRVWNRIGLTFSGEPREPAVDSEEHFISDHFWSYTAQPNGSTREYRVERPVWRYWPANAIELECDVAAVYGRAFVECLSSPPSSAFLVDGSAVIVRHGERIEQRSQRVTAPFISQTNRRRRRFAILG